MQQLFNCFANTQIKATINGFQTLEKAEKELNRYVSVLKSIGMNEEELDVLLEEALETIKSV